MEREGIVLISIEREGEMFEDATLQDLKLEKGALSQGILGILPLEAGKEKEKILL